MTVWVWGLANVVVVVAPDIVVVDVAWGRVVVDVARRTVVVVIASAQLLLRRGRKCGARPGWGVP